jgi:hypothetical protein
MPPVPHCGFLSLLSRRNACPGISSGKQAAGGSLLPNLRDYDAVREAFTWKEVRAELAVPGGLNIACHALDRHIAEGDGDKVALRWLGKNGEKRDITYCELLALSCRFANLLHDLGVGRDERVSARRCSPSDFYQIGATKPFAVIEYRDDVGGDPDQKDAFLAGQCVP